MYRSPPALRAHRRRLTMVGTVVPLLVYGVFLGWALVVVAPGRVVPATVDQVCLFVFYIIPIPLVLALGRRGVLVGAVVVWATLYLAGVLLSDLDPQREGGLLDTIWLLFGWVWGLLYCGVLYAVRWALLSLSRRVWRPGGG